MNDLVLSCILALGITLGSVEHSCADSAKPSLQELEQQELQAIEDRREQERRATEDRHKLELLDAEKARREREQLAVEHQRIQKVDQDRLTQASELLGEKVTLCRSVVESKSAAVQWWCRTESGDWKQIVR